MSSSDAGTETVSEIRESITATHQAAGTRLVEAGVRFAFRRSGLQGPPPLLTLQHFRGNFDAWEPGRTCWFANAR